METVLLRLTQIRIATKAAERAVRTGRTERVTFWLGRLAELNVALGNAVWEWRNDAF